MKKILLSLFILLSSVISPIYAQHVLSGEEAIVNVLYDFYHVQDLNHPDEPAHQQMLLSMGKTWSKYQNYDVIEEYQRAKKAIADMMASGKIRAGGRVQGGMRAVVSSTARMNSNIYQNTDQKLLVQDETVGNKTYRIQSDLPQIKWTVINEKKQLGDFTVQRAEGSYAGRKYTAWFSPDLPFGNGPWKLSGLPGLILEATDDKGEVRFIFKEIYKDEEPIKITYTDKKGVNVSQKQLDRLRTTYNQDPIGTINSQNSFTIDEKSLMFKNEKGETFSGEEALREMQKEQEKLRKQKSNPLELTNKK